MRSHDVAGLQGQYGSSRFVLSEAVGEAVCGMATIVLAIIGLTDVEWTMIPAIATIIVGVALMFEGAATASRWARQSTLVATESYAVMSTEFLGGVTGVILGVLAVLGTSPDVLVSVAVIVYGAALIVGSIASDRFHSLHTAAGTPHESLQFIPLQDITFAASGAQVLVGLAAGVLGIIALLGAASQSVTLSLVALLVVGAYIVMLSTELARRMMRLRA